MNKNIKIKSEWIKLNIDNYKNFSSKPAIYRWIIDNKYYIGETINLKRRISNYKNPGKTQWTNIRLNKIINKANEVELYKLEISYLKIDDYELINDNSVEEIILVDSFVRKLLENYFLIKIKYLDNKKLLNAELRKHKKKMK